jgi:ribosomal RNA-processing protein 9
MSSFFTSAASQKKRKRPAAAASEAPKKRFAASSRSGPSKNTGRPANRKVEREAADDDDSISGSSDESEDGERSFDGVSGGEGIEHEVESDNEGETAAEKRLRLAERYLENVKEHVDDAGFDAADIDRDLIAERLQEDVAESKGRIYRQLASGLAFSKATRSFFRTNTSTITSIAACAPHVYTTTKDLHLQKWKTQELPQNQYPQTTKRKPKKTAPPKKRPELTAWLKGDTRKSQDADYQRHSHRILAVAASADGKYVVTGGQDRKLIVYDAATLKPIKVFTHHRDAITGLAFRRGSNQLYSCSKDRTVKVWSIDDLAYVETLFGHQDEILDIDALAQDRCVSVGARDRTARLWKVAEETQLVFRGGSADKKSKRLPREGSIDRISMLDDDLFVTGSDSGAIALWSVSKKKPVCIVPLAHGVDPAVIPKGEERQAGEPELLPTPRWITSLKTIPYSDVFFSGSWDGFVRVWRLSDDKRNIESLGVLSEHGSAHHDSAQPNGTPLTNGHTTKLSPIRGVINDLAVFERGERAKDGVCVVAAIGNEHKLGRWKGVPGSRNGCAIFEIPKIQIPQENGAEHSSEEDDEGDN